jgi:Mlc titration factor MtfA (ptsG expression regulator)
MGVEMIIFGHFDEFGARSINAFYDSGTLYISNVQDDVADLYDDIIHEYSHSLEEVYGYEIYGDQKIKDEFLRKRKHMHDILWKSGYKAPLSFFMNAELDEEFDKFLHEKVGYDKLSTLLMGLFITPYAATSLSEYFATGFAEYYQHPDSSPLPQVSPALYKKILLLQKPEALDRG